MKSKLCLSLDTTGFMLGVCLLRYSPLGLIEPPLAYYCRKQPLRQSDHIIPVIHRMLKNKKLKAKEIDLIVTNVGPGSFTGVRVGVSTARALAQGLTRPLVAVNSLEALAFQGSPSRGKENGVIIATLTALKNELYFAAYKREQNEAPFPLKTILKPQWNTLAVFSSLIKKLNTKENRELIFLKDQTIRPDAIGWLGIKRYLASKHSRDFVYENCKPLYLQPSWAERKRG